MGYFRCERAFAIFRHWIVYALVGAAAYLPSPSAPAHEGHDHDIPASVSAVVAPRMSAQSDRFEIVGVLRDDRLTIFLDRAVSTEPVKDARIAVTIGDEDEPNVAEPGATGTYSLVSPRLRSGASIELVFSIAVGSEQDLLIGTLETGVGGASSPGRTGMLGYVLPSLPVSLANSHPLLAGIGTIMIALCGGYLLFQRRFVRAGLATLAAIGGIMLLYDGARSREADVAANAVASPVDAPRRLPDGRLFVPKPSQRLLEVRTVQLAEETAQRGVTLIGRTIADPNRTSLVQSIIGGRVLAPETGLPSIGQTVQKGDLLARIEPTMPQADRTTILERLGEVEQLISVAEARLRRARILVDKQVVAQSQVADAEIELEGLRRRREVLREIRVAPEELRAATPGVIAAARVVPGQVVQSQDVLFQIVDPGSIWVEALVYGELDPTGLDRATASFAGRASFGLRLIGFSRALQQQATIVHFAINGEPGHLSFGLPVTVTAAQGAPVSALILPKDAVVRSSSGEMIVWLRTAPELFEARPVRIAPFDAARVMVSEGIAAGDRIVVNAADLVNQVR